jgi:RNA polymerase sigma-70 factor (ECF subfamily)
MDSTSPSLLECLRDRRQHAAWERFVSLYAPLLAIWAHRLGMAGPDREELVQEVFTVLVEEIPKFEYDPSKRFRGWLWTITLNIVRQRLRKKQIPLLVGGESQWVEPETVDPAVVFSENEYRDFIVKRAVTLAQTDFTTTTWKAFWEFVALDKPAAEVARNLGISENAVYVARVRVIRRLRQELAGLLD